MWKRVNLWVHGAEAAIVAIHFSIKWHVSWESGGPLQHLTHSQFHLAGLCFAMFGICHPANIGLGRMDSHAILNATLYRVCTVHPCNSAHTVNDGRFSRLRASNMNCEWDGVEHPPTTFRTRLRMINNDTGDKLISIWYLCCHDYMGPWEISFNLPFIIHWSLVWFSYLIRFTCRKKFHLSEL